MLSVCNVNVYDGSGEIGVLLWSCFSLGVILIQNLRYLEYFNSITWCRRSINHERYFFLQPSCLGLEQPSHVFDV
jgi:hypothetical protein